MLPEGWKRIPIGELGDVQAGRQRAPSFTQGRLTPYLRVANVFDGWIDTSDVNQMPFTAEEYSRYELKPGDILLNEGQSLELVGRPAMYQGLPENCCFQNTLIRFRPSAKVDPDFALKRFQLCLYDGTFQNIAKRTTSIAHLGVSRFAELVLAWPPLDEQRRVAEIIEVWNRATATAERILANSRKQKLALMEILLTGGFGSASQQSSWRRYQLGDLFAERVETRRADLPLLSITRDEGVIRREDVGRKDTSNEDKSKYQRICPGDIGYNTMRMWQGVSALSRIEGIVSPAYTVVTPSDLIDGKYAAYLFKSPHAVFQFCRYSQGLVSDTWNLKFPHFAKIKIRIPGRVEQESIVKILSVADDAIAVLERQATKLKSEKRALMAQLLTGRRRVRVSPAEAAL